MQEAIYNVTLRITRSMDPELDKVEFDTIMFDNGDYYEGQVLGRVPHGEGTMFYDDGRTVTCKWIYGNPVIGKKDERIPDEGSERDRVLINNQILYVGYGYSNETITQVFGVSRFIRGIRLHHDRAVLLSMGEGVYQDGSGWEKDEDGDDIFVYTGEGLDGDQELTAGNLFLKKSAGKGVYLFVKRRPNEYVFHGQVVVKRIIDDAQEKDRRGIMRRVFKFILCRV